MATSGISSAFTPGITEHFFIELSEYPQMWREFYHERDMTTPFVDLQGMQNYGQPTQRMPGEGITFDAFYESFPVRIVPDMWSMGDSFPEEDVRDDIYGIYTSGIAAMGGGMARSFRTHLELQLSGILTNFGFVSGSVLYGPDRVSLMSLQHPISRNNMATYYANRPAIDMNFGIAAYNFARTNLLTQPAPDGYMIMSNFPKKLCINPTQHVIANQVARSQWQPNTADRNDNVFRHDNLDIVEWVYWRKSGTVGSTFSPPAFNGWFIQGMEHYLYFYMREAFNISSDSDFSTRSQLFAAHIRWGANWSDGRGFCGSPGS